MNRTLILGAALTAVVGVSTACSATLVYYNFNDDIDNHFNDTFKNDGAQAAFAPTTVAPGLTASNVLASSGGQTIGARVGNNSLGVYPDDALLVGTSGTGQFEINDYLSITITPDALNSVDFESITLQGARGGGSDRGFVVRSSLDGFTANLNGPETESMATQRPTFTDYTIDLTASAFDSVATPLEFRFYVYSTAKDNTVELDNITFNGSVASVPEPGSLITLGLTALGLAGRRRHLR